MKILFLGDVVGQPGRNLITSLVPELRRSREISLVVVNGENAAGGKGIDPKITQELLGAGVDVITGGNHSWDKKEIIPFIDQEMRLLRPANYPQADDFRVPGRGQIVVNVPTHSGKTVPVAVINLMGRVHMEPVLDCPFVLARKLISDLHRQQIKNIVIDFHAEATSEKQAFGHYVAGMVTAVLGTHSHVQTADERLLKSSTGSKTAYITDAGMTGPYDSVIGMRKERSISRFVSKMPVRFEPAEENPGLHGVIVTFDEQSGSASGIERVSIFTDKK